MNEHMNIASALKSEISRIARREVRAELTPLKKASSGYRYQIAALKKQVAALERSSKRAAKRSEPVREASDEETKLRFRAGGLAAHRARLGLSAADFGRLIGVSGQSVYAWERGKTRPQRAQLEAIAGVRKLGKREALAKLAEQN